MNLPGGVYQKELIDTCLADPDLFYKAFADVMDLSDSTRLVCVYMELKDKLVSLGMEDRFPDISMSKSLMVKESTGETHRYYYGLPEKAMDSLIKLGIPTDGFYHRIDSGRTYMHNPYTKVSACSF